MRLFYRLFYILAKKEQEKLNQPHSMRYLYYYNAKARLGEPIKILILLLLSLFTNSLIETALAILAFGTIRINSGGFHAMSSNVCLLYSFLILNTAGIISRYSDVSYVLLAVLSVFAVVLLIIECVKAEIMLKSSMLTLLVNLFVAWLLNLYLSTNFGFAIILGALGEIITMTNVGNKIMDFTERKLFH